MSVPAKRRTKSQKRRRASHFALTAATLTTCRNCGKPVRPHHVCLFCGTYNGRQVLSVAGKGEKKLRKREKERKKKGKEKESPESGNKS